MIDAMSDEEHSKTVAAGRADQRAKKNASRGRANFDRGRLKIGDDWNAIRIIALSQSNPLKAIAEFVENSIDAQAKTITITRGASTGSITCRSGMTATECRGMRRGGRISSMSPHISVTPSSGGSRRKAMARDCKGSSASGLLSFWTVGDTLTMTSTGNDQRVLCAGGATMRFMS